jgi:hypothetical protein
MMGRLLVPMILSCAGLVHACECVEPSIKSAKRQSAIVFRGTVIDIRDSGKGYKTVVFRVIRVWKGRIGVTLEMPAFADPFASPCVGLWPALLEIGGDLLVYAHKVDGYNFLTSACSRTRFAIDSQDFKTLGLGKLPISN